MITQANDSTVKEGEIVWHKLGIEKRGRGRHGGSNDKIRISHYSEPAGQGARRRMAITLPPEINKICGFCFGDRVDILYSDIGVGKIVRSRGGKYMLSRTGKKTIKLYMQMTITNEQERMFFQALEPVQALPTVKQGYTGRRFYHPANVIAKVNEVEFELKPEKDDAKPIPLRPFATAPFLRQRHIRQWPTYSERCKNEKRN